MAQHQEFVIVMGDIFVVFQGHFLLRSQNRKICLPLYLRLDIFNKESKGA